MEIKLGDLFEIGSGATPSKLHPEYYGGNIPWVKTGDLKSKYLYKVGEYITEEGLSNSSAKMYNQDTVLIAMYGATIGATSILKMPACTNQACAAFKKNDRVVPEYLYYFLKSHKEKFIKDGVGGAQPNISAGYLKKVKMNLITIEEQRKIVEVLDTVSRIIDKRKYEKQALDDLVKARFVEMFGEAVSNSKSWETQKMDAVAPIVNFKGEFYNEVWLLNLDMVESQTGRIIDYLIVPKEKVGNSVCAFDTTNVLYSKLRPYLNKVVIPDRCGYATSELIPLQPVKTKINREYLTFMLRSNEFVNMISEKVAGAKMPRVLMKEFRKFEVPVPPIELQNQFADFVHQIDKSKIAAHNHLKKIAILLTICSIIGTNMNGNMGRIQYDNQF